MGKCPGQNMRFWGPGDIFDVPCPQCGEAVEFFRDDSKRRCANCGKLIFNPRQNFSCAAWCPAARDCLGPQRYESLRQIARQEKERKNDMEALLDTIPLKEWELRLLFKQMYLEQGDPQRLFDARLLQEVKEKNPALFQKAVDYYQQFLQRRKKS